MSEPCTPRNPSSFADALTKDCYASDDNLEDLKRHRQGRVDWLRKKYKSSEVAQDLADKIEGCRPKRRCKSLVCPECADAAQRLSVRVTRRHLKNKEDVVCVTIVPTDGLVKPGVLSLGDHQRFMRRTKDKIGRAYDGVFIGGIDWSFNESKEKAFEPYWCQHVHGIAVARDAEQLKVALKKEFPSSDLILRPIKVRQWDGEKAALRYLLKDKFERRISTTDGTRFDKKTGENRQCRDADHQPLKSKHKLELFLHLSSIGISGRLLLKNVQFLKLKGVGPTLVNRFVQARSRENEGKVD